MPLADALIQSNVHKCFKTFTNEYVTASPVDHRLRIQQDLTFYIVVSLSWSEKVVLEAFT